MKNWRRSAAVLTIAILALTAACASPTNPTDSTGTGGNTSGAGTGGSSTTGLRTTVCGAASGTQTTAQWATFPSLPGLDVKIYWSQSFNLADFIFRNRYQQQTSFNYAMYAGGSAPATNARTSLAPGNAESGVGHGLGEVKSQGAGACVVVDKVRFGTDSGTYYNP